MKKIFLLVMLAALLAVGSGQGAQAAPQGVPLPRATHAALFKIEAGELGQQIQALVTGDETVDLEPQETFGTRALGLALTFFDLLRQQSVAFLTNFAALPQMSSWLGQQISDPTLSDRWLLIGQSLLLVVGASVLVGWGTEILLLPLHRRIKRKEPKTLGVRLGLLGAWLVLSILPLLTFLITALLLIDQNDPFKRVRFFTMSVVYAVALWRAIRLVARFFLAPKTPHLRLIPVETPMARSMLGWINAFAAVVVCGYFASDVGGLMKVPLAILTALRSIIGLLLVGMTIAVILQKRQAISLLLRGQLTAAHGVASLWSNFRLWLARVWHVLAISYLVIGYVVTTLSAGGGFEIMQKGTLLTLLTLVGMRLGFYAAARVHLAPTRHDEIGAAGILRPVLLALFKVLVWALGVAGIAGSWGVDVAGIVSSPWGQRILGSVFSISSTFLLAVLAYEALHALVERKLSDKGARAKEGGAQHVNARARTLLPMLHNAAILVLGVIIGLVTLSELGINIAPLLAGAGVLGVAVGFGSQTLIKDFLTGLFIILEDTIAVGDVVTIGEHTGVVEGMTIRTVRLRDQAGDLHVLPFSEITKITNKTKDYSFAPLSVDVSYGSDLRKAMELIRAEGDALRSDPAYCDEVLEPVEILGVDKLGDFSITLAARMKTRPGKQWEIKRAYLLRIKERFDKEGIEIPFPTVMQVIPRSSAASSDAPDLPPTQAPTLV